MYLTDLTAFPPVKLLGLLGAGLYILNYIGLTLRLMSSESRRFFVLNLMASTFVMISLSHEFNAASAVIQSFWIVVSLYGLITRMRPRRAVVEPTRLRPLS